jgi:hypothetical protein
MTREQVTVPRAVWKVSVRLKGRETPAGRLSTETVYDLWYFSAPLQSACAVTIVAAEADEASAANSMAEPDARTRKRLRM